MPTKFPSLNEQMDLIARGAEEIIPKEELVQKIERAIKTGTPLNVKLGADPSRPDLHIGHAVVLQKLRDFQDLGHQAILIVGDFTAMIGDPTGQSKTRPALSLEETRQNGQTYFEQATKILSSKRLRMVYNSEWLGRMSFADVIMLASKYTVSQMLEREDFHKRFNEERPISLHEMVYPLAQAFDSVAVESDVELGGTDQKFNLLVGRDIQRSHGQEPQAVLTTALLVGTDGVEKMSKSLDNYIGLNDFPNDMYGKVLSIPDAVIPMYYKHACFYGETEVKAIAEGLAAGTLHPRDLKRRLAREIVARYTSEGTARKAEEEFDRIFIHKDAPEHIEEFHVAHAAPLIDIMVDAGLAPSKAEAKRLIQGGGVSLDGAKVTEIAHLFTPGAESVLKVGKRRFLRLVPNA
ncbi:MAG TPA: tyrosine--tRNA ligase [Candidatus Kapabacteria bacterium]|nr:tyrosine--tRNA ligase [Candidatus Kapabacteria bacterium]